MIEITTEDAVQPSPGSEPHEVVGEDSVDDNASVTESADDGSVVIDDSESASNEEAKPSKDELWTMIQLFLIITLYSVS